MKAYRQATIPSLLLRSANLHGSINTDKLDTMTGAEVIEEIKRLPSEERAKVLAFTRSVTDNQPLTPEELGDLANRMVETKDSAEADRLKEKIVRGFYGGESHG